MDAMELHRRTTKLWMDRVTNVPADAWSGPTPCSEWNVRELVNHVTGEDRWTPPLMEGKTIADVGSALDGDLLGHDPQDAARTAALDALASVEEHLPRGAKVHLSYGDEAPEEYLLQLAADHLVHGWDLAAATGGETRLDPELVDGVAQWFAEREEMYRSAGAVGARPDVSSDDPQDALLASFGRDPGWRPA